MNLYRAFRQATFIKWMRGKEPFYWIERHDGVIELGSKSCRWAVDARRVNAQSVVLCFGLGEDVSFETELIARFGCQVRGFDPTPRAMAYVKKTVTDARFSSYPIALADHDGELTFNLPRVGDQVSASAVAHYDNPEKAIHVPCKSLPSVMQQFGLTKIDVLKMDIEGAEYAVIQQAIDSRVIEAVDQLLVEFHHFLPGITCQQTVQVIESLKACGFDIAWIGRTNHEYLFVRRAATLGGS